MTTVGLISPGKMGASVGAMAASNGHRVIWSGNGRSESSHARAADAGLEDCGSINRLVQEAEIILSVCPPHDAESVARQVRSLDYRGIFADCNAISPGKTRQLAAGFDDGQFVDGGIIGGPAWTADAGTRLYVCGKAAGSVADLFTDSHLEALQVEGETGAASAVKMTFAAYTKGSTALLAAILAVAEREGVREPLERQWGEAFSSQTHRRLSANAEKAWRFSGEMREIASTFAASGMPAGFHLAAADVFDRLATFKDQPAPDIDDLLRVLLSDD